MLAFTARRLLFAVPTLLVISFVLFALLALAPGDPTGDLPLTIPDEVREQIRLSLGLDQPFFLRYLTWLRQFFLVEPLNVLQYLTGWDLGGDERVRTISWATRSPVAELIAQRLPQTLTVVGFSYLLGVLIAIPIGVVCAYYQYSLLDQIFTLIAMIGYSLPSFFTGVLLMVIFSVWLQWFPSVYDTNLEVRDWHSFLAQIQQMVLPVAVLTLYNISQIARFVRAAVLENIHQDYVRTARAKGVKEKRILFVHVLRNGLIPVVTVIALGIPTIFSGAIVTEQIFRINGIGQLLISAIQGADFPLVQTLTFIFAILIVLFNVVADVLYCVLDPRIRYD